MIILDTAESLHKEVGEYENVGEFRWEGCVKTDHDRSTNYVKSDQLLEKEL